MDYKLIFDDIYNLNSIITNKISTKSHNSKTKIRITEFIYDILLKYELKDKLIKYSKSDYIELLEKNKNIISYYYLDCFLKNQTFLKTTTITQFEIFCNYIFFNTKCIHLINYRVYKLFYYIKDIILIYNYIYFCYIQCVLNFFRIDFNYYYSFKKAKFYKYKLNNHETYKGILNTQMSYIELCIDNYNKLVDKFFNRWIDYVLYKINYEYPNSNMCIKYFCITNRSSMMYNTITKYCLYAREYYKLIYVSYSESKLFDIMDNVDDEFRINLMYYKNNFIGSIYIVENENLNDKNMLYKIFIEQLKTFNCNKLNTINEMIIEDFDEKFTDLMNLIDNNNYNKNNEPYESSTYYVKLDNDIY